MTIADYHPTHPAQFTKLHDDDKRSIIAGAIERTWEIAFIGIKTGFDENLANCTSSLIASKGSQPLRIGDTFTVQGFYETAPNPDRRWWQLWKPKRVNTDRLKQYTVTSVGTQEA